jgi:hypothetical protein
MGANRFIFRRAQILSHPQLTAEHCMVKNIYNAKQNPSGIGAILRKQ